MEVLHRILLLSGTSHTLYDYLDDGKTVFLEIFAAHCSVCWNYHQSNKLKDVYNAYGPGGTDEAMVLALEYDQGNDSNAFLGIGDPWQTQGNWLAGTPYPLFNVEGSDRSIFTDYNVTGYPVIYRICPDRITERVLTNQTVAQLYLKVQDCQIAASIEEEEQNWNIHLDQGSSSLIIDHKLDRIAVHLINLQGQIVRSIPLSQIDKVDVSGLSDGLYLIHIQSDMGSGVQRVYIH
jgi:hypothetical protein